LVNEYNYRRSDELFVVLILRGGPSAVDHFLWLLSNRENLTFGEKYVPAIERMFPRLAADLSENTLRVLANLDISQWIKRSETTGEPFRGIRTAMALSAYDPSTVRHREWTEKQSVDCSPLNALADAELRRRKAAPRA
jgi:hypothetical protein